MSTFTYQKTFSGVFFRDACYVAFANQVNSPSLMSDETAAATANNLLAILQPDMEKLTAEVQDLIAYQHLVNRYVDFSGDREKDNLKYGTVEDFHEALTLRELFATQRLLWSSIASIDGTMDTVSTGTVEALDTESIDAESVEEVANNVKVLEVSSGQIQKPVGGSRSLDQAPESSHFAIVD